MTKGLLAALLIAVPAAAQAQDTLTPSFGFAITSNYFSKGQTQSDDKPAAQAYLEGAYGMFYGGVWTSTVELDADRLEVDLYAGVRPTLGEVDFDISYVRYLYNQSGDCCGEAVFDVSYPVEDFALIGAYYAYDTELKTDWLEGRAEYYFADVWFASVNVGNDFGTLDLGPDHMTAYDVGFGRSLGDNGLVDLRYHDSNYTSGTLVVSIGADF